MADPLSLLRQYNIQKKEIIEKDGQIIFGEFSWPKNTRTNFGIWRTGNFGTTKKYYTLECLLYLLKNVSLIHPVYIRQAAAENIPVIRRPDRKELLQYLYGEIDNCAAIDKDAPWELPTQVNRSSDYGSPESIEKKPHIDEVFEQQIGKEQSPCLQSHESIEKKPCFEKMPEQKVEGNLVSCLDGPENVGEKVSAFIEVSKEATYGIENTKPLSEVLSGEKIAAIKAKRLTKKRIKYT